MISDVTIVIPAWNRADLLRRLLATISAQSVAPERVLVMDNGSMDDAPDVARDWGAEVIPMGRNAGFSAAANRGIATARTRWIALVNSDVELDREWLEILVSAAVSHQASFATGMILSAANPQIIDGTWDLVARSGWAWRAGHGSHVTAEFLQMRAIALTSATAVLYNRSLFDRIGLFSEIYESYFEDVDLALRGAAAGLKGLYVPEARCLHHGSASAGAWSPRVTHLTARNQAILVRRLFPQSLRREWQWNILVGQLLWAALATCRGRLGSWLSGTLAARRVPLDPLVLDAVALRDAILASEREVRALHRDLYWRLYFFFTGGASE